MGLTATQEEQRAEYQENREDLTDDRGPVGMVLTHAAIGTEVP
jgi:hypothetical protein